MATLSTAVKSTDEATFTKEVSKSAVRVSPRRVLGDISPNIRIRAPPSSAFTRNEPTTTPNGSPLKTHLALTPADVLSMKDSYGCPPSIGSRKRPFAAIDEAYDHEDAILKRTMASTETSPNNGRVPSMIPVVISLLNDDESGEEDEDLPAAPAAPNNPIEALNMKGATASFSSLIDYDPAAASDKSQSASLSPPASMEEHIPKPTHAETLRLRLRMAMYKIKTNQTQVPLDALEVVPHAAHSSLSTILAVQPPQSHSDSPNQSQHHEKANSGIPKLLPAPILRPTAYSSRKIEYVRSSPPTSPEKVSESDTFATPIAARRVQQLLNMPGAAISPEKERVENREDLTSSVVKGRAASSLLELMRAV